MRGILKGLFTWQNLAIFLGMMVLSIAAAATGFGLLLFWGMAAVTGVTLLADFIRLYYALQDSDSCRELEKSSETVAEIVTGWGIDLLLLIVTFIGGKIGKKKPKPDGEPEPRPKPKDPDDGPKPDDDPKPKDPDDGDGPGCPMLVGAALVGVALVAGKKCGDDDDGPGDPKNPPVPRAPIDYDGHIFNAEIKPNGNVVGGHSTATGQVKVIPGTATVKDAAGVYKAKIEVADPNNPGQFLPKTNNNGVSTMFPDNWGVDRVKYEVDAAFYNKSTSGNMWSGTTPSGVRVQGYLQPKTTVYPLH